MFSSLRRRHVFPSSNKGRRRLSLQRLEQRQVLSAMSLTNAVCGPEITYEVVTSSGAPVSSVARVFLNEQGAATTQIDLQARKIPASQEFFVDALASGSGDGRSWSSAFRDIRDAILTVGTMSVPSATFHVAEGIYSWGDLRDSGFSFNIIGAGMGKTVVEHRAGESFVMSLRNRNIYIEDLTFRGGEVDIRNGSLLTVVDTEFTASAERDGINVVDVANVVVYGAYAHHNQADGFSYTNPGGSPMEVFEAFVTGSDNGQNGLWNSQGSSIHDTVKIVRVGSSFERNPTNISDVSSFIGWNIDVTTRDALANEQNFQYLNYNVSGGGIGWIIAGSHGEGFNSPTVVNAVRTAEIRYPSKFDTLHPSTHLVTGNSYVDNSALSLVSVPCTTLGVGALKSGVAVEDQATGSGYLMFSSQSVHTRFASHPPNADNSDQLIAVRVVDGEWQYNDDLGWHSFTPAQGDRLLATIDYSGRTISSLKGTGGKVNGISRGYVSGDLAFLANQWNGAQDSGEYSVTGTYFDVGLGIDEEEDTTYFIRSIKSGIAVDDNATGTGYVLYSPIVVQNRFTVNPADPNNSEHLLAVRVVDGDWQYNNNLGWHSFVPVAGDRLLGTIDFSAQTISSLQGAEGSVEGIPQGYVSGDLTFLANTWNGKPNTGEYTVTGTLFTVAGDGDMGGGDGGTGGGDGGTGGGDGGTGGGGTGGGDGGTGGETTVFQLGNLKSGIAVEDRATGSGYVMFSAASIHQRFSANPPNPSNSDHLVAVRVVNGQWEYNDNLLWQPFTPTTGDRLLATIDYSARTVASLKGATGTVDGIDQGYASGDLVFLANWWSGKQNSGEYSVTGTYFDTVNGGDDGTGGGDGGTGGGDGGTGGGDGGTGGETTVFQLGDLKSGIAVEDRATGSGYVMFSAASIHTRFSALPPNPSNSDHLIAVRVVNGQWEYNDNLLWQPFTPAPGDRLLATIDYSARTIASLKGATGTVEGIDQGYVSGDLVFLANWWSGKQNSGEYSVTGTYFDTVNGGDDGSGGGDGGTGGGDGGTGGGDGGTGGGDGGTGGGDGGTGGGDGGTGGETTVFQLGDLKSGIAVEDRATGSGYVMFSAASVHTRFSALPPNPSNSDHLIAVRVVNGQWEYNDNLLWQPFTPTTGDRLLATIDYSARTVASLKGATGTVDGIDQGYASGDLVFLANWWSGKQNSGEYSVTGTYFDTVNGDDDGSGGGDGGTGGGDGGTGGGDGGTGGETTVFQLGDLKSGIAVEDRATGSGYVMFSAASIHQRFSANPANPSNSDHLIAVRVVDGQWEYNDNLLWQSFVPAANDRLLASIDFSARTISSLQGATGTVDGIDQGYASGDLVFLANWWSGKQNTGEYTVTGTFFDTVTVAAGTITTEQPLTLAAYDPSVTSVQTVTTDVNGDGMTTALDALRIINRLSRRGPMVDELAMTVEDAIFDVNGDGMVTAMDALRVINFVSRSARELQSEANLVAAPMILDTRLPTREVDPNDQALLALFPEP